MVTRSLVVKIYAYGVAVFVTLFLLSMGGAALLVERGQVTDIRQVVADGAAYIGVQAEGTLGPGGPSAARLDPLAHALHFNWHYLPWGTPGGYPAALATTKFVQDPQAPLTARPASKYWIRLDAHGHPQGVLQLESSVWHQPTVYLPAIAAGIWMAVLALVIVPPLVLWVLRPLRRMVAVAHHLGEGGLDEPVLVTRSDEFGELEHAFENLRQRVQVMLELRHRLLGDISHELRGPLGRIQIALSLVQESGDAAFFLDIRRELGAMDMMIGELLEFARGRSPSARVLESLDLAELARELETEQALTLQGRRLTLALAAAPLQGDRRLIRRAMSNLLDNALKYGRPGGDLQLSTGLAAAGVFFRVEDDGPGIAAAHLPHVFEPFYRPDVSRSRETGGVGLGLAIVRAVADGHGGEASLRPNERGGTIAELRLPSTET